MTPKTRTAALALTAALMGATALPAMAETLRWARAGDALTMDPHAQNEGPTTALAINIMEPLVIRDMEGTIVPSLATEWAVSEDDPNVWVFTLRDGVTFHDGAAFTSDDVKFSIERAKSTNSNFKELLNAISEVRTPDDLTVEIVTNGPNPIIPENLTNILVMDRDWAEANGATEVQNYEGGEDTYAAKNANGTGPYRLVSREPDVKTVLQRNEDYWGMDEFPMGPTAIEYTPIQNAATRVAALLSGEVDFIQDVPVQDIDRVGGTDGLDVRTAPQNRTIFFGMNVGADDLDSDDVEGANPFADVRVRQAMNMAINRDAIQQVVMRGQSEPTGVIMPPFVNGWTEALDAVPEGTLDDAKALMEEAGYGDGFSVQLDCPNDRYINDEAICQAVVGMMGQIGITVNLDAKTKAQHFPLITDGGTDFYLLGWGVPTYDSEYIFNFLVHSRTDDYGSWNATGYGDADLDARIEALASEVDLDARNAEIQSIWDVVQEEVLYLPVHHQVLNWGMKTGVGTIVAADDTAKFKYFTME